MIPKTFLKNQLLRTLTLLPFSILRRLSGQTSFSPYYHLVSEFVPEYVGNSYPVATPQEFEKELDLLLKYYCPVDLSTLILTVKNNLPLPKSSFHLTFDDGYREVYDVVFPILRRKGIPATFFICSDLLDNRNIFWENLYSLMQKTWDELADPGKEEIMKSEPGNALALSESLAYRNKERYLAIAKALGFSPASFLQEEQPYLTSPQIREMMASGFTIGSHSIDHPLFKDLILSEQLRQIEESCRVMAETFQLDYRVFAFPYGEFGVGKALFETLQERGTIDLLFGTRGIIPDEYPWVIQRFGMEQAHVWKAIRTELAMKWIRRQVNNDLVTRRQ